MTISQDETDDQADRAQRLFELTGAMLEGLPHGLAGTVIAQLLASWLMAWPVGEHRAYALGTLTGAAVKLCGGINGGQSVLTHPDRRA
jgi:hypothetical protein